ncbi:TetR/AcrR family transcriptional regulator [Desertibacillus haloalkaliphilus]|uniref:TetR/AcrR family transcriptional regulator n=1 Tax=Desertibacillus haloalkaliphilus TaxID=1328930 RepID=UPI001C255CFB|nr:TetR/AcrR family transcriptional regulator [Desertibacillus haloalkaliphilus]MBU8908848.1 TetR/AcrR family transcriptional regulator [Desertibacillus haloalkaliphilus]
MKEKVFKVAIERFSHKGFFFTSMQQIAEDCGMSKATLYKYFESKEDLLIQLFEYTLETMFAKSEEINRVTSLSKKERLQKKIFVELDENLKVRAFLNLVFKSIPIHQNLEVISAIKQSKVTFLNWHRDCLREAYGEQVDLYVWDMSLLFQGTLREYIDLLMYEKKPLDKQEVAAVLVAQLDMIVAGPKTVEPALRAEMMSESESVTSIPLKKSREQMIKDVFRKIKQELDRSRMTSLEKKEASEAVASLEEELKANEPRKFIVEALCYFLERRIDIKQETPVLLALVENSKAEKE